MERLKNIFSLGKFGEGKKSLMETPANATKLSLAYKLKEKDLGKLHKAASVGDLAKLEDLIINQKKDVDKMDQKGRTALQIACALGHVHVVQFLVEAQAILDMRDGQNRTALMKAVQGQHESCVIILLEKDAAVDLVDVDGNTALHLAANSDSVSIARQLLTQGGKINALNNEGLSPLSMAVRAEHVEMAELLLKNGADVNAAANSKRLPLMIATVNEMFIMTRLLLRNWANLNEADKQKWSLHRMAVMNRFLGSMYYYGDTSLDQGEGNQKEHLSAASQFAEAGFSQGEPASDMEKGEASQAEEGLEDTSQVEEGLEDASQAEEGLEDTSQAEEGLEDASQSETASLKSTESEIEPETVGEQMMEEFGIDRNSNSDDIEDEVSWDYDDDVYLEIAAIKTKTQTVGGKMMEEFGIGAADDIQETSDSASNQESPDDKMNTPASERDADEPSPNTSTLLSNLQEKEISTDKDVVDHSEDVDLQGGEQSLDAVFTIPKPDTSRDKNRDFMSELGLEDEESEQESSEYDYDSEEDTFPKDNMKERPDHGDEINQGEYLHNGAEIASESDADEPSHDAVYTIPEPDTSRDKNRGFMSELGLENKESEPESSGSDYDSEEELPTLKNKTGEVRNSNTDDLEDASERSSASSTEDDRPHVRRKSSPDLLNNTVTPQESLNSCARPRDTEITPRKPQSHEDSNCDTDCPSDNEMMEEDDEWVSISESEPEEEPAVISSTTDEGRMLKEEKENEHLLPIKETNTSVTPPLSFNSSPLSQPREVASQKPQRHEDSDSNSDGDTNRKSDDDPMKRGQNDPISPEPKAASTLESEPEGEPRVISSKTDVIDDEGKTLREKKENFEDLTQSVDTTADKLDSAASFMEKLNLRALDSTNMIQLQNIFREYESTIQKLKNKNSYLSDEVKEIKPTLELQTEIVNLKYQLEQEQESQRKVTEAYNATKDKLQRTEEQRQLETREKQKMEVTLRNKELEMRTLVNNTKQLEEETRKLSETLKLLAQKSSARTLQDDLLNSHPHKQQEVEEDDGELQQQTSTLQEQIRNLRGEVEHLQANNSLRENHILEENKTLKRKLQEAQREVNTETVLNCKHQLSTLKSDLDIMTKRFENEKQARETLEKEVDSNRSCLATAVQEAERCTAAKADAEKRLLRERKERQRLKDRLAADRDSHREEVSSLSLKLSKAERENNSLEEEQRRITLQLTEKRLLLDGMQKEKERLAVQVEELDKALQSQTELLANKGVSHEAAQEQLAQAQGEVMLLRQQLDEANDKCEVKEKALTDAQKDFSDKLSKAHFDCGEKGRSKKLARKTADLRDQVFKLEEQKACALKDLDKLKDQHIQAEKRLTEKEEELAFYVQTLKESQSGSSASTATNKHLEEAVQRLERIKNKAKEISEQKTNVEARLDQEINTNSELQKEMDSLRESLKTAEKRLNDLDMREETHPSMNMDARKAQNLQIQLDRETLRRRQLEKDNIILGEELASLKRSEQYHLDELHELRRRMDFTQREGSQSEERTRLELQYKLEQVNRLLETQAASQKAKDQINAMNLASLQTQLEQRIRTLESEASRAQTSDSLSQQNSTRIELEKYKSMYAEESLLRKSLAAKLERANSKLLSERTKFLMASNPLDLSPENQGQNQGLGLSPLSPVSPGLSSSVERSFPTPGGS